MTVTAPPVLLPYQQRWLRDPARVKVIEKSRRIGATWCTAADCVLDAASGDMDTWYVSYSEDSSKEYIRDCAYWCEAFNIAATELREVLLEQDDDGKLEGIKAQQIVFPSGKRITALTSNARSLRGKQGRVIIDEAAFHDDLPGVLKAAMALLMWGGQVLIMSTHNGVDNLFNRLCEDVRDGKRDYSLHRVTITDALEEGLYRRICAVTGETWSPEGEVAWLKQLEREYGDGVREELYCEPLRAGVSYLSRALIESCMVDAPVLRIERSEDWIRVPAPQREEELLEWCDAMLGPLLRRLPRNLPHAFGWDFGRVSDRSVLAPFTIQQNLVAACPFLLEMLNLPHGDQWTILRYVGDRMPNLFRARLDAGGNGAWIAEQALMEWGDQVVEPMALSQKWYAETMPRFKESHESRLITYPRDLDVRDDLGMIVRIDGIPKLPSDKKNASHTSKTRRHGDAAIALALGHSAACEASAMDAHWRALSDSSRSLNNEALYALD